MGADEAASQAHPAPHFNSRPRAGGDRGRFRHHSAPAYFNSRPRAGGDRQHLGAGRLRLISIHAPARGATFVAVMVWSFIVFQFTPPRGGRPTNSAAPRSAASFQFTPPRGGRRGPTKRTAQTRYFNSRPRAGGDASQARTASGVRSISIHAPARGATQGGLQVQPGAAHFNSRPRAGGDAGHAG